MRFALDDRSDVDLVAPLLTVALEALVRRSPHATGPRRLAWEAGHGFHRLTVETGGYRYLLGEGEKLQDAVAEALAAQILVQLGPQLGHPLPIAATTAAAALVADLEGRPVFASALEQLAPEARSEILATWAALIEQSAAGLL